MKTVKKIIVLLLMLLGLPIAGVYISGHDIAPYLEFPPKTRFVAHAPFSAAAFLLMGLFVLLFISPFLMQILKRRLKTEKKDEKPNFPFPWWGYCGIITGTLSWVLAWTRFEWATPIQMHTFTPLWISYIVFINALTVRRNGASFMLQKPLNFLLLFPVSALFWWFFEYLNRFVQNWYYVEVGKYSPLEYFLLASISFSTVLPAVLSTREYLLTFHFFKKTYGSFIPFSPQRPKLLGVIFLILSGTGLACIGVFPNHLYSLIWISPLVIITSLQMIAGEKTILTPFSKGEWQLAVTSALAALLCGFMWEMWNYYSLSKWIYSVPLVQRFHIFEMPVLGYAGYIPFGLECAVIAGLFINPDTTQKNL